MSQPAVKGLVRLSLLERVTPDLLVRFLRPYEDFLTDRGVELDGVEHDHEWVGRLHRLLTRVDPGLPGELQQALLDVADLANTQGHELALELAGERQVSLFPPGSELSPEDLAFRLHLEASEIFVASHTRVRSQEARRFVAFYPAVHRPMAEFLVDRKRVLLVNQLRRWFGSRNRSEYVDVRVYDGDDEVTFLVIHGRAPRSLSVITSPFSRDRLCIIPDREDTIHFEKPTGKLSVNAQHPSESDFYRKALGKIFFDNDDHFEACSVLSGEPLLEDAEEALSPEGIAGLEAVSLRGVTLKAIGEPHDKIAWTAKDLRPVLPSDLPRLLDRERQVTWVKLALHLRRYKRPKLVVIEPPNKLTYDRRTGEEVVRDFLFSRGYMRLPHVLPEQQRAVV